MEIAVCAVLNVLIFLEFTKQSFSFYAPTFSCFIKKVVITYMRNALRLKSQYLQALKIATLHENFSYRIDKIIDKTREQFKGGSIFISQLKLE